MTVPLINVVAGCAGSGKTAWIHQQIQDTSVEDKDIIYFSPGTGNVSIEAIWYLFLKYKGFRKADLRSPATIRVQENEKS